MVASTSESLFARNLWRFLRWRFDDDQQTTMVLAKLSTSLEEVLRSPASGALPPLWIQAQDHLNKIVVTEQKALGLIANTEEAEADLSPDDPDNQVMRRLLLTLVGELPDDLQQLAHLHEIEAGVSQGHNNSLDKDSAEALRRAQARDALVQAMLKDMARDFAK